MVVLTLAEVREQTRFVLEVAWVTVRLKVPEEARFFVLPR
jgi:hypothetical protein